MAERKDKCMVCGKAIETSGSICQQCQESIRGEAVGKRKKVGAEADKAIKKHGQKPPQK